MASEISGYSPYGALNGLSWTNQFVVATGAQYRLTDRLLVRAGYTFNTSPYGGDDTFYNVASSLNYQHQLGLGGSWEVTECVAFHVSYQHYFEWDSTGPIVTPDRCHPRLLRDHHGLGAHRRTGCHRQVLMQRCCRDLLRVRRVCAGDGMNGMDGM